MDGLSVVIPIYNVEAYLDECLESVIKSMKGLTNIQVILVNDGSLDQSDEIARRFAAQHSNFDFYSKKNGGLSDARNYGLNYVKYNYIAFIDSDDFIDELFFTEIFKAIEAKPDLIIFDWMDVGINNDERIVCGIEVPESLWTVQPSAWNKVYNKKLFEKFMFPKNKIYEDVGTTYKLLHLVDSSIYINKPLYKYRKDREGSILSSVSPKIDDIYWVLDNTYSFYEETAALTEKNINGLCYQYIKLLMWSNMYRQLKYYKLNFFKFYKKMKYTRKLIYGLFPEWKKNHYLRLNSSYFEERFGKNYVHKIDCLGSNFIKTLLIIIYLIIKNKKK